MRGRSGTFRLRVLSCQFVILSSFCLVVFWCSLVGLFYRCWMLLDCWVEEYWCVSHAAVTKSGNLLPMISATDRSISHTQQDLFWQNSTQRFWGRFCFYHSHLTDCGEKFCWWLMNPEIDEHKYARYPLLPQICKKRLDSVASMLVLIFSTSCLCQILVLLCKFFGSAKYKISTTSVAGTDLSVSLAQLC